MSSRPLKTLSFSSRCSTSDAESVSNDSETSSSWLQFIIFNACLNRNSMLVGTLLLGEVLRISAAQPNRVLHSVSASLSSSSGVGSFPAIGGAPLRVIQYQPPCISRRLYAP